MYPKKRDLETFIVQTAAGTEHVLENTANAAASNAVSVALPGNITASRWIN